MACSLCELVGLGVVAVLLFSLSTRVQYYVKMTTFIFLSFFSSSMCIPLMLHRPRDWRNALIPAWFVIKAGQLVGADFELQGLENINKDHGGVVVINHQSGIDLIVLAKLWSVIGRPTQISKKEILYFFPFSLSAYLWGTIFVDRQNHKSALKIINQQTEAINGKKSKILFFPEGTRNQSETLLPFKKGVFHVAIQSQCAIQPVVVSRYFFLDSKRKSFRSGKAVIKILPEISCQGLDKENVNTLLESTQKLMQEEFEKLSDEVAASSNKNYF